MPTAAFLKTIYFAHGTPIKTAAADLAVIVVDLDHFKAINDTYGHLTGDEVLRFAARLLAGSVRGSDLVARYGGEEFVVVAFDCSAAMALTLAERFRNRLAHAKIAARAKEIAVTASLGIAVADKTQQSGPVDFLHRADEALYQAKRSGRNAVWIHDRATSMPIPATAFSTGAR